MTDWISDWWTYLSIGMTSWVLGLSIWILFERRSPVSTLAWIFALSVLPIVGIAVYYILGPRKFDRKKLRRRFAKEATRRIGNARKRRIDPDISHAAYHLMEMCERAVGPAARPRRARLTVFSSGDEKYAAMIEAIEAATHHIHLEYYIWEPDKIGTRLRDALVSRAENGVEVRVHVDSFGSSAASRRFWRPLKDAGGRVERFNSLALRRLKPRLANFRTHRKIMVVDGSVGFVGGMNIADYHLKEFRGDKAWRDTHARLEGPAVRGLQLIFCEGWHYSTGVAPEGPPYFPDLEIDPDDSDLVQTVSSGPDEDRNALYKLYFSAIASANHRVLLSSGYFVPDATLLVALAAAALRGAHVQILVPHKSDVKLAKAAGCSYYAELLEVGVRIFEYTPAMFHAKTLVVDNTVAVIATANADTRSFKLNFEVGVLDYEAAVCDQLAELFEEDLKSSIEIDDLTVASYSFGRRLFQNFARLLSPML